MAITIKHLRIHVSQVGALTPVEMLTGKRYVKREPKNVCNIKRKRTIKTDTMINGLLTPAIKQAILNAKIIL